jgi:putative endonuclease
MAAPGASHLGTWETTNLNLPLLMKGGKPYNGSAMEWLTQMRVNCMERTLAGLDWLAAFRRRGSDLALHLAIGIEGEDAAYFHLARKGYKVVARRWSSGNLPGDIDLIAWQGSLLCFIEVKARSSRDAKPAEAAVDSHKRATLRRLARHYVRQLPHVSTAQASPQISFQDSQQVRFDVISVYLIGGQKDCIHFENAFGWSERRQDWD